MGNTTPSAASSHERANASSATTPTVQATSDNGTNSMTFEGDLDVTGGEGYPKLGTFSLGITKRDQDHNQDEEESRPPLPPRPSLLKPTNRPGSAYASKPTTGLSSIDIQTLSFPDGSRGTFSTPASRSVSESVSISGVSGGQSTPSRKVSRNGSELDDSASLMSYVPTLRGNGDLASLLDEGPNSQNAAWKLLSTQKETVNAFEQTDYEDQSLLNFEHEFDEIEAVDSKGINGGRPFLLVCISAEY